MPSPQFSASVSTLFSVGSVLSRTFSTLLKNPAVFFGLSFAALLPTIVFELLIPKANFGLGLLAMALLGMVLNLVIQGAIAYGVYQVLRGESPLIGESVLRGMARILPLILVAIFTTLCIGLGFLLLVIPGIILLCMLVVTVPVCVVERQGAIASMNRSVELTKGYRLTIFGLLLITNLAAFAIGLITEFLGSFVLGSVALGSLVSNLLNIVPQAFECVMAAIIYYDLRAVKEGVSIDSLVNVFD